MHQSVPLRLRLHEITHHLCCKDLDLTLAICAVIKKVQPTNRSRKYINEESATSLLNVWPPQAPSILMAETLGMTSDSRA